MRRCPLFFLVALTLAAIAAPGASAVGLPTSGIVPTIGRSLPIQPLLQVGAQLSPLTRVRVIIQKTTPLADNRLIAVSAQATVVEEFGVIPAFTADLNLGNVLALATNPNVRYVSSMRLRTNTPLRLTRASCRRPIRWTLRHPRFGTQYLEPEPRVSA